MGYRLLLIFFPALLAFIERVTYDILVEPYSWSGPERAQLVSAAGDQHFTFDAKTWAD